MQVTQGPTGTRDSPRIPAAFGLTAPEIEGLLVTAGRAPSLHNSQPWQFRVTPRAIELHADPRRSLVVADPDGRELRIACGAALFNLELALHGHGIRPIVTILPDRARPGFLAAVRHGGTKDPTPEQQDLLQAVAVRRTNRHPFTDAPVDTPSLHALRRAASDEGAWLHIVLDPEQRSALRTIAARAHREQAADPAFRAELAAWITTTPDRRDGVPASAAGARPEPQDAWVLRDFTAGTGAERVLGKDFETEPVIAVLSSHLSGPSAEIRVGQALQRVLLTATVAGLATSFLSHVVEVPDTREELRRLIGGTRPPQAVLRIGHGWPVPTPPHRRVEDLLAPRTPVSRDT
jgi:nitroreductase